MNLMVQFIRIKKYYKMKKLLLLSALLILACSSNEAVLQDNITLTHLIEILRHCIF